MKNIRRARGNYIEGVNLQQVVLNSVPTQSWCSNSIRMMNLSSIDFHLGAAEEIISTSDAISGNTVIDELMELVAEICQTPIVLLKLGTQQWLKFITGAGVCNLDFAAELLFCQYTLQAEEFIVEDAYTDVRFVDYSLTINSYQIRSYAGVPLTSTEGKVLGILAVMDEQPHSFNYRQIQALHTIGHQIEAQIELQQHHSRVHQLEQRLLETEFQQQQQTILFQLASQIRTSLDLDTVLQTAVREIHYLLHVDRCQFLWCLSNGSQLNFAVTHEAKLSELPSSLIGLSPGQEAFLSEIIPALQMLKIEDVSEAIDLDLNSQELLMRLGIQSQLLLPLKTQSGQLGAIICSHYSSRPWLDSEVNLLKAITDQLAIALEQAELFNQVRTNALVAQTQAQYLTEAMQTLQKTQAQLIQHEKMSSLGQLVAGVAHEINNPVNFISGNIAHAADYANDLLELLEVYQEHYPLPVAAVQEKAEEIDLEFLVEDLPKLLASMRMGTDRIRQIVLSLRNFSRLDESEVKPVDIHEGIDNTLMILQSRLKSNSIGHSIQVTKAYASLPLAECYAGQLNQVFMNLLGNAIDALDEVSNPTITITTELLPGSGSSLAAAGGDQSLDCTPQIRICIRDNGCGMTETVQQKLFNPFFTTKPVGKGTGLGLSISYQIVAEKHHGTLQCLSAVGQGTEFQIQIPLKASPCLE